MTAEPSFSVVTRDELWSLDRQVRIESRLIHGSADQRGNQIDARDDLDHELFSMCESECDRVRAALAALTEGRARTVVSATRNGSGVKVSAVIGLTVFDLSVATTLPHLTVDHEKLVDLSSVRPELEAVPEEIPIVWRNGSAAVLLHEAAGHAAEHGDAPLRWPQWLTVVDESDEGTANLLAGEAPRATRRQSFSDVPMPRMSNVVVGAKASTALPSRRIDVYLVAGGRYEPLSGMVSLSVAAADLVDGGESARIHPFVMQHSRGDIARAIRGAAGEVRRYPGVICTKEGQELFVASYAPDLVTEF